MFFVFCLFYFQFSKTKECWALLKEYRRLKLETRWELHENLSEIDGSEQKETKKK